MDSEKIEFDASAKSADNVKIAIPKSRFLSSTSVQLDNTFWGVLESNWGVKLMCFLR